MSDPYASVGKPFTETAELRARYRRLCLMVAVLAGGALALLAGLNVVVDPFGAFGFVHLRAFDGRRDGIGSRTGKAEVLRHQPHHTVLLGSSRTEVGMDPAFLAWGFPAGGPETVNLGLGGTNMAEMLEAYRFASRRPGVREVVLCLDFLMFTEGRTYSQDFTRSRLNPLTERPNYHMSNLFSRFAAEESVGTLRLAATGRKGQYTEQGFRAGHDPLGNHGSHRKIFVGSIRNALRNPEVYGKFVYSPRRVEMVGEIVRDARARGLGLVVVVPPVHALELETVRAAGLWDEFEGWKRDLVVQVEGGWRGGAGERRGAGNLRSDQPRRERSSVEDDAALHERVPLWDFADYTVYSMEAVPRDGEDGASVQRMRWFWESSHFTRALGERVANRMAEPELATLPPDAVPPEGAGEFGVRLTSGNIESHLKAVASRHEGYVAAHAGDMELIEEARR